MIYEISRIASAQIDKIILYTDQYFGPKQTSDYVGGLYHSFHLLSDNPSLGREWDSERRRYTYRAHHIYYKILADRVLILDIRSARQDVPPA